MKTKNGKENSILKSVLKCKSAYAKEKNRIDCLPKLQVSVAQRLRAMSQMALGETALTISRKSRNLSNIN